MKFMLLIHGDERVSNAATPPDATVMSPDYTTYNQALMKAGAMIAGSRLRPTTDAASVRVRNGRTEVLDGPYAETREQFGGYYMIEAPDMDTALDWAVKCPAARTGTVEVRPVWAQGWGTTMQYLLLIYHDDEALAKAPPSLWSDYAAFNDALAKAGVGTPGERLAPSKDGRSVTRRADQPEILDGPYADTKEQFAGYLLLDVPDIDTAVQWAARCPSAQYGTIEVRPLWTMN